MRERIGGFRRMAEGVGLGSNILQLEESHKIQAFTKKMWIGRTIRSHNLVRSLPTNKSSTDRRRLVGQPLFLGARAVLCDEFIPLSDGVARRRSKGAGIQPGSDRNATTLAGLTTSRLTPHQFKPAKHRH
jgi:hypothetical protein